MRGCHRDHQRAGSFARSHPRGGVLDYDATCRSRPQSVRRQQEPFGMWLPVAHVMLEARLSRDSSTNALIRCYRALKAR